MPEKRLGLDIQSDAVRAVVVKAGLKPVVAAHACVPAGEGGLSLALRGVLDALKGQTGMDKVSAHVAFGKGGVSFKDLSIPFTEPRKIRQVLAFELESKLPVRVEEVVADYHIVKKSEATECIAAATSASNVSEKLDFMASAGLFMEYLSPSGVTTALGLLAWGQPEPESLFVDVEADRAVVVLFSGKKVRMVRCLDQDFSSAHGSLIQQAALTLRAYAEKSGQVFEPKRLYLTGSGADWPGLEQALSEAVGCVVSRVDLARDAKMAMEGRISGNWDPMAMNGALALALFQPSETVGFNLRQGAFAVRRRWEEYKSRVIHAAVLAAVLLLALSLSFFTDIVVLDSKIKDIQGQVNAIYASVLPDQDPGGNPVGRLAAELEALGQTPALPGSEQGQARVVDILKAISEGIPSSIKATLDTFSVSSDGVQLSGETETYESAIDIKTSLEGQPIFQKVTLVSASDCPKGDCVKFRIKAQAGQGSAAAAAAGEEGAPAQDEAGGADGEAESAPAQQPAETPGQELSTP